jgi:hypothetical protein
MGAPAAQYESSDLPFCREPFVRDQLFIGNIGPVLCIFGHDLNEERMHLYLDEMERLIAHHRLGRGPSGVLYHLAGHIALPPSVRERQVKLRQEAEHISGAVTGAAYVFECTMARTAAHIAALFGRPLFPYVITTSVRHAVDYLARQVAGVGPELVGAHDAVVARYCQQLKLAKDEIRR